MPKLLNRRRGQALIEYGLLGCRVISILVIMPLSLATGALFLWSTWNYWVVPTFHVGEVAYLPVLVALIIFTVLMSVLEFFSR